MRTIAHQKILANFYTELAQVLDLGHERDRIDNYAIADDEDFSAAQNSRRNEMENVGRAAVNDGVAGVVTALAADDDIGLARERVNDLAVSFVARFRSNHYRVGHVSSNSDT